MKTILVTGGAGFIGSSLVDELLDKGYYVICYDNFEKYYDPEIKNNNIKEAKKNKNYLLYKADILDVSKLAKCFSNNKIDIVIHLAAKAGVRPSLSFPADYQTVNVIGTINILETMRIHNVKNMIFASSSSVYGKTNKESFNENDSVDKPISPYACSKKAAELLCYAYHHLYDLNIFCLRFFTVYGPRQRPDLAIHKFTNAIMANKEIEIYGDGGSKRDYTYIKDAVSGILHAMERVNGYDIFNIGESRMIILNDLIELLEKQLNMKALKKILPAQPGDLEKTFADINKAKTLLNYEPKWEFEEGLKEFIKYKMNVIRNL